MKYIYPHLGLGDFFICNGLIRKFINLNENYFIFTHKQNYFSLKFMFKDLKNVDFIIGYEDYATNDNFVYEYIKKNNLKSDEIIRITLNSNFNNKSFDENFYLTSGVNFEERWDNFKCDRDLISEENLFNKLNLIQNDYIFVHDDIKRNYIIKEEYLKNKKIIRPVIGLTNNIFDYLTIIERAEEVHCMDSSFRMMIDSYSMDKKLYFHTYCRNHSDLAQSRNKWIKI